MTDESSFEVNATKRTQFCFWITSSTATMCELLARQSGFDVLLVDGQHGAFGLDEGISLVTACSRGKPNTICAVRVSNYQSDAEICRYIDAGAQLIICPMINTKQSCELFVNNCYYPPLGIRSFGPYRHKLQSDFNPNSCNLQLTTLAMIETKQAYENLHEILLVPNLSGIFIGPNDLALSLGHSRSSTPTGKVLEIIKDIMKRTIMADKIAGIFCADVTTALYMSKLGFKFVVFGNDINLLVNEANKQFTALVSVL